MLATKSRQKTDPAEAAFEAARAVWIEAESKHRELRDRLEGMRFARSLEADSTSCSRMPQHLRDRAKPFRKVAGRSREKFARQIADAEYEVQDYQPAYVAAHEAWEIAQNEKTSRIAIGGLDGLGADHHAPRQWLANAGSHAGQAAA